MFLTPVSQRHCFEKVPHKHEIYKHLKNCVTATVFIVGPDSCQPDKYYEVWTFGQLVEDAVPEQAEGLVDKN